MFLMNFHQLRSQKHFRATEICLGLNTPEDKKEQFSRVLNIHHLGLRGKRTIPFMPSCFETKSVLVKFTMWGRRKMCILIGINMFLSPQVKHLRRQVWNNAERCWWLHLTLGRVQHHEFHPGAATTLLPLRVDRNIHLPGPSLKMTGWW